MSFNDPNNPKIMRNDIYNLRQGNNYKSPFRINNNVDYYNTLFKYNNNNLFYNNNQNNPYEINKFNYNNNYNNIINDYRRYNNYNDFNNIINNNNDKLKNNFHYLEPKNQNNNININKNFYNNNNLNNQFNLDKYDDKVNIQNKNRKQKEYSEYLKQQIEEKNKRKKIQKEKEKQEDLKLDLMNKEFLRKQKLEFEKEKKKEKDKRIFYTDKKNINKKEKKFIINNDINKNLEENIKRAQTPLISDHNKINQEITNRYNFNKNNNLINNNYIKNNDTIKRPVSSIMLQSGQDIIDNLKNKKIINNTNNNNNLKKIIGNINYELDINNLKIDSKEEENTEIKNKYINFDHDTFTKNEIINNINTIKNDIEVNLNEINQRKNNMDINFTFKKQEEEFENPIIINESLKGGSIEKILDLNNKISISNSLENNNGNYESINSNFTFGKNSNIKYENDIKNNMNKEDFYYHSKYENNNIDNNANNDLEKSLESRSKLINALNKGNLLETWKQNSIKEEIYNENENNNIFENNNKDLYITFGEVAKESQAKENKKTLKNILNSKKENDYDDDNKEGKINDEYLESEGICNFYKETKKIKNVDLLNQVSEALKDAKESSEEENDNEEDIENINRKLNYFEDTIGKIKKKKNNDIINNNDREKLDMIISGEIYDDDLFKSGESTKNINKNINI